MIDHRLVEARAIAVVGTVHLDRIVGMLELDQAAIRAPDQLERPAGDGFVGRARKHAGQRLDAEIENRDEMPAPAATASLQLAIFAHGFCLARHRETLHDS